MHDLRLLQTLVQVADAGALVDAADVIGCTPSAVSQQMSRLEREVGVQLLLRGRDGVTATAAGQVLIERARALLGGASDAERAAREAADWHSSTVRLASFSTASIHVLPDVMSRLGADFPRAELSVIDMADHERSCEMVLDDRVDLALIHEYDHVPLTIPPGVVRTTLGRDRLDVLFHRSHPLAKTDGPVRIDELRGEAWVLYLPTVVTTRSVSAAAGAAGFVPRIVCEVADSQVASALVASRVGVTVMPGMVTRTLSRRTFAVRRLQPRLQREISIVHRPSSTSIPVLEATRRAIAETCAPLLA